MKTERGICNGCNKPKFIINRTHWLCGECNAYRKTAHKSFLGIESDTQGGETGKHTTSTSSFITNAKNTVKIDGDIARNRFFKSVWDNNDHKCYECSTNIPFFSRVFIHHIIEKNQQKYYSTSLDDPENGIILCLIHHDQCRLNLDKVPKVKELTKIMLLKYEEYKHKQHDGTANSTI